MRLITRKKDGAIIETVDDVKNIFVDKIVITVLDADGIAERVIDLRTINNYEIES